MKPTKLFHAQHEIVAYAHSPEYGVTLKQVMEPTYWSHVARLLRPGFTVVVTAPDMTWRAELMVRAVGKTEVLMGLIGHAEFGGSVDVTSEDSPYEIKWRGPARKFGVIRKEDGAVVKDEFQAKEYAAQWIKNHIASMAA